MSEPNTFRFRCSACYGEHLSLASQATLSFVDGRRLAVLMPCDLLGGIVRSVLDTAEELTAVLATEALLDPDVRDHLHQRSI